MTGWEPYVAPTHCGLEHTDRQTHTLGTDVTQREGPRAPARTDPLETPRDSNPHGLYFQVSR